MPKQSTELMTEKVRSNKEKLKRMANKTNIVLYKHRLNKKRKKMRKNVWHCAIKIIRKNKARHVITPSGQHHKPSKTIKSNVPCMISTDVWFTTIDCSHTRTNLCHIFFTCTHCWSSALSSKTDMQLILSSQIMRCEINIKWHYNWDDAGWEYYKYHNVS